MELKDNKEGTRLDLTAVRQKLAGKTGKKYWRTLEEVAETPEFQRFLDDEFPNRATLGQIDRRSLLKFMGASMALAGLGGCRGVFLPEDKVVPYVKQPEELVPGEPLYYASSVLLSGYATGVLVEQHEGRPILLQGNPEHPASLGALDVLSQAEILSLYDPDRAQSPTTLDDLSSWETFEAEAKKALKAPGSQIRLLTGAISSPTLIGLIQKFLAKHPGSQWHCYEPCGRRNSHLGAAMAYGTPLNTIYDFSKAKVVVAFDSDFLMPTENPGSLRYAREFANGRRVQGASGEMNRLYAFESTPGLVGIMADHRWPVKASEIYQYALALAVAVGVEGVANPTSSLSKERLDAVQAIAQDLSQNKGSGIVITGEHQPAQVHALVEAINFKLTNVSGGAVLHTQPVAVDADISGSVGSLKTLVDDMNSGQVSALFILDSNPAYTAPSDLKFADAAQKVGFKAQLGSIQDETTDLMTWHLPLAHTLEGWGDARAFDGTAGILQPLLAPVYDSKSPIEFMALLLGSAVSAYDLVRGTWKQNGLGGDFEKEWRKVVYGGTVPGSKFPVVLPTLTLNAAQLPAPRAVDGVEIVFRPDPTIYDGRFSNNGWLQELPKPVSKVTWDNVAVMSAKDAEALDVVDDDLVTLSIGDRVSDPVAVFIQPGHASGSVTVHLGYGRTKGGVVATVRGQEGGGFNAYALRTGSNFGYGGGLIVKKLAGQSADVASTQGHGPLNGDHVIDERDVIRETTLAEFIAGGKKALVPSTAPSEEEIKEQNLYPEEIFETNLPQWGMTIDMNTCIGCNACVTACQAENNIPVVGKEQVARHREMHWIRIDRYYKGDDANPQVTWQPVACVHCEKAPCEPVCPVAATVHSHEGLNQMIYNRCVGTRYCSNNCPYKVRRFNYLNYSDNQPNFSDRIDQFTFRQSLIPGPLHTPRGDGLELLKMMNNPDVSVRGRGIMEKCSYCVQRINYARIEAKKQGRDIRDGEIVTACQQACPTQTIVFGNVADKNSAVSRLRSDPRSYLLLEELQTRPRTSHLAKLRNPNPAIKPTTEGA